MKHKDITDPNATDQQLSEWIKKNAPDAPEQPWFTKNVINRLPDRLIRRMQLIERMLYIIGIITIGIFTIQLAKAINTSDTITTIQIFSLLTFAGLFGALIYGFLSPISESWQPTDIKK